jgi:hypothetical protein
MDAFTGGDNLCFVMVIPRWVMIGSDVLCECTCSLSTDCRWNRVRRSSAGVYHNSDWQISTEVKKKLFLLRRWPCLSWFAENQIVMCSCLWHEIEAKSSVSIVPYILAIVAMGARVKKLSGKLKVDIPFYNNDVENIIQLSCQVSVDGLCLCNTA